MLLSKCFVIVAGIFQKKTKIVIILFVIFFFLHQIHACVLDMITFNSSACMFLRNLWSNKEE